MVLLALACAAVLISTAVLAVVVADDARARQVVYGACLIASLTLLSIALLALLGFSDVPSAVTLPLGIPWLVLLYGLLGGCVSCIVMLGRQHTTDLPGFVVVTWFARPFIGAILAALAYLALNSGILVLTGSVRNDLFSLVGALAGLCEGWIFYRRV